MSLAARAAEPPPAEPLPIEPVGQVKTLPKPYPTQWVMVLDSSFLHMLEGKGFVVDALAPTVSGQTQGLITLGFMAGYEFSAKHNEHYVVESFFARGGRGGKRTDMVTIWDPQSLEVKAEVEIPAKRITGVGKRIATALVGQDRFILAYNFTPAQSVSVVDLERRQFVGEVAIAGCGFVIPNGKRSFSSICADGSLLTTKLNSKGKASGTQRSKPVFDVVANPAFEAYGLVNGVGYFPTFQGQVVPIDLNGALPKVLPSWWLTSTEERVVGWRPGGSLPIVADKAGRLYLLMHPEGAEGTHKNGGGEVWVFDAASKTRVARIRLKTWGTALGISGSKTEPLLVVSNANLGVDIYNGQSGEHLNTLALAMETPLRTEQAR